MTDLARMRNAPPREICEHGSQKAKCVICENAALISEVERLRGLLQPKLSINSEEALERYLEAWDAMDDDDGEDRENTRLARSAVDALLDWHRRARAALSEDATKGDE